MRASRAQGALSPAVRDSGRIASWIVGLVGGCAALGGLLEQHRAGSLAVQAFAAEWGAGRLGVAWSDPERPPPPVPEIALRVARGLLLGLGAAVLTLAFAGATGAVAFHAPHLPGSQLVLGLFIVGLVSLRDELILRGLVLRAFGQTLSASMQLLACALVAAAAQAGQMDRTSFAAWTAAVPLLVAGLTGAGFAMLWRRERGAYTAWGAHVGWLLTTTTVISGGVCDGTWGTTPWGGSGFDASLAVGAGVGLISVAAVVAWYRAGARTE
jgi:hypothetical protein